MIADERFTHELKAEVDTVMGSSAGALTKWNQVLDILVAKNIAYKRQCSMDDLFVHPKNRSGMGLNAFNVHRNLAVIKTVGCDHEHLRKATAFEVSALSQIRESQLGFNVALIKQADGLLAPATGAEKFLTVACSHTAASFKAIKAGCRTSEVSLKDPNGNLNLMQLSETDKALEEVVTKGMRFTIIPWQAEQIWPTMPDLAQSALNAEHAAFSMATELQAMAMIGINAKDGDQQSWNEAVSMTKASMPPCHEYLDTLAEFVKLFGGVAGTPMVWYLDIFCQGVR